MTSAPNTVTYKSEVYYRIRDETVNIPSSNMVYYINIFGNKLVRLYKSAKAGLIVTELHPYNSDGYINIKIQNKCKKLHVLAAKTFINPFIWNQLSQPTITGLSNIMNNKLHKSGDECNTHQRFTLRSFINLLQKYVKLIRFTLYSIDGVHISAIRINNVFMD
jgi:hypothetical protein